MTIPRYTSRDVICFKHSLLSSVLITPMKVRLFKMSIDQPRPVSRPEEPVKLCWTIFKKRKHTYKDGILVKSIVATERPFYASVSWRSGRPRHRDTGFCSDLSSLCSRVFATERTRFGEKSIAGNARNTFRNEASGNRNEHGRNGDGRSPRSTTAQSSLRTEERLYRLQPLKAS